jgi:2-isopropylmalate synthase
MECGVGGEMHVDGVGEGVGHIASGDKAVGNRVGKDRGATVEAIVNHNTQKLYTDTDDGYKLEWFQASTSNFTTATCTVCLMLDGEKMENVALGDGPIDAAYKAIDEIIKPSEHSFDIFNIHSISEGKDTLGDVTVKITAHGRTFTGRGLSTDILEASINAYLKGINRLIAYEKKIVD